MSDLGPETLARIEREQVEANEAALRDSGAFAIRNHKPMKYIPPEPRTAVTQCLADVQPIPIQWLWSGRIAKGKLTLLVGDPGLGKSFVTLDMASHITTGQKWPDGAPCPRGSVLLLSAEDDPADTIRPRLDSMGADVKSVHILQAVNAPGKNGKFEERSPRLTDIKAIEETLKRVKDIQMICVDPVSAYLGETDSHNNAEVRGLLMPLAKLAADYHVAIIGVSHLNKSQGNALYRTMGSLGMIAAARGAWLVTKDPDNEQRRLFLPLKNNLGPDQGGLAYHIEGEPPKVVWESDPVHITASEALSIREESPELDEAVAWLKETLTKEGVLSAKEVQQHAKDAGHAWRTVRRAEKVLNIKPTKTRFDGGWEWKLPKDPPSQKTVDTFGNVGHLREFPEENTHSQGNGNALFIEDVQDVHDGQGGLTESEAFSRGEQ